VTVPTFDVIIVATVSSYVRNTHQLELCIFMLVIEEVFKPFGLLNISHGTMNIISACQQLIGNIASDESIDAGHEDRGARLDDDSRHGDSRSPLLGGGVEDEVSKKGQTVKYR
jgi:hypothetical protein